MVEEPIEPEVDGEWNVNTQEEWEEVRKSLDGLEIGDGELRLECNPITDMTHDESYDLPRDTTGVEYYDGSLYFVRRWGNGIITQTDLQGNEENTYDISDFGGVGDELWGILYHDGNWYVTDTESASGPLSDNDIHSSGTEND